MLGLLGTRERWPLAAPGGRVRLRPIQLIDVQEIRAWLRDPELVRLAFGLLPAAADLERVAREYCREIRTGRRNVLGIETRRGELIGFVRFSLRSTVRGVVARVGILIGPTAQRGMGLGTDAMRALLDYLFDRRRVMVIELDTADFNVRAQRCFEKCGFRKRNGQADSVVPLDGSAATKVWMEICRASWRGSGA